MQTRVACDVGVDHAERPDPAIQMQPAVTADVADENRRWVQGLSGAGATREQATGQLYPLLLRAARAEVRRRFTAVRLTGPERDDVAYQAASDALLKICAKIETFRGECRFTTWAYKFVVFDVAAKLSRHFWQRDTLSLDPGEWDSVPSKVCIQPELAAESRDLAAAVSRAVLGSLTARQRTVFVALVVDGTPMDEVARKLDATANAIYKTMFDARRKLRSALEADGYLPRLSA